MYEAFFGLDEKPFNLTPDPRFLYLSEKHKEAFAHLKYAIANRTGFVMVSGEVGTGKTTICRSLVNQLDVDTELAFIFNPMLSPRELLRSINEDFGIQSRGESIKELIDELNEYLLARNAEGKNCVLVLDEAQNLAPEVLEQVRLLSNLETTTQKLLQVVLIGQPELAHSLALPELRQLNQRITARYHLMPLSDAETLQYIACRLRVASGRGKVRFSRRAIRRVHKLAGGTPRRINAICDRALLVAFTRETRDISVGIVRQAARELRGPRLKKIKRRIRLARAPAMPEPRQLQLDLPPATREPPPPARPARWPRPATALVAVGVLAGLWYVAILSPRWTPEGGVTLPAPALAVSAGTAAPAVAPPDDPPPTEQASVARTVPAAVLDGLDPAITRAAAGRAILRAWHVEPTDGDLGAPSGDSWQDLAAFGRHHQLDYCLLYPATDQLKAINLPAFVRMTVADREVWLALTAVDRDTFVLTTKGEEIVEVSQERFRTHFTSETVILWKDPTPDALTLTRAMAGEAVTQLQKNLQSLGRYAGLPSGHYDEATATAVAKIQAETGLRIDGMAGKEVRMVLCSWWLSGIATPSLRPTSPFSVQDLTIGSAPAGVADRATADEGNERPDVAAANTATAPEPTESPEMTADIETAGEAAVATGDGGTGQVTEKHQPSLRTLLDLLGPSPEARVVTGDVLADDQPPAVSGEAKEVTPPALATSPLVPREPDETEKVENTANKTRDEKESFL